MQQRQHLPGTRCAQTLIATYWWGAFQRPKQCPAKVLLRFFVADTRDEAEDETFCGVHASIDRDNVDLTWSSCAYLRRARCMVFPTVSPSAGLGSSGRRTNSSKIGRTRRQESKPARRMTRLITGAHQLCSGQPDLGRSCGVVEGFSLPPLREDFPVGSK